MRKPLALLLLLALPAFSADFEPKGGVLGAPGGRFVFGSIADGSILFTFMLDTQTGRLWRYSADKGRGLRLVPIVYELADGSESLLPLDSKQELDLLQKKKALEGQTQKGNNDGK